VSVNGDPSKVVSSSAGSSGGPAEDGSVACPQIHLRPFMRKTTVDPNETVAQPLDPSRFALSETCSTSCGTNGPVRKQHYPGPAPDLESPRMSHYAATHPQIYH
jgi:hypothetical protein